MSARSCFGASGFHCCRNRRAGSQTLCRTAIAPKHLRFQITKLSPFAFDLSSLQLAFASRGFARSGALCGLCTLAILLQALRPRPRSRHGKRPPSNRPARPIGDCSDHFSTQAARARRARFCT